MEWNEWCTTKERRREGSKVNEGEQVFGREEGREGWMEGSEGGRDGGRVRGRVRYPFSFFPASDDRDP